jgi:hypothetical protein
MDKFTLTFHPPKNTGFDCRGQYYYGLLDAQQVTGRDYGTFFDQLMTIAPKSTGLAVDAIWDSQFQFDPITETLSISHYTLDSNACLVYLNQNLDEAQAAQIATTGWIVELPPTITKDVNLGSMKDVLISKIDEFKSSPIKPGYQNLPEDNFLESLPDVIKSVSDDNGIYTYDNGSIECISSNGMMYLLTDSTYQKWHDNFTFCRWSNLSVRTPNYLWAEWVENADFNLYGEIELPTTELGTSSMVELLDDNVVKNDAYLLEYVDQITKLVINVKKHRPAYTRFPTPIKLEHRFKDSLDYYYVFYLEFDNSFDEWKDSQLNYLEQLMNFDNIFNITDKQSILNTARTQWSI